MELAVIEDVDAVARELDGRLTQDQVNALEARERSLYETGGDVKQELPRLQEDLDREMYSCLLPGYVRQYIQNAAPLIGVEIEGDMSEIFSMRPSKRGAMDKLLPALEAYGSSQHHFTVSRPEDNREVIWLHPGEPVFEQFRSMVNERISPEAKRGAVLVDPTTEKSYLFHVAFLPIVRKADPEFPELAADEVLECRLVGVKQYEGAEIELCPVEQLLLLKGGTGLPSSAQRLAITAGAEKEHARAYLIERVARHMALERKKASPEALPERESFIKQGYDFQEAELAMIRAKHAEKARGGNRKALEAVEEVKRQQKELYQRREASLSVLHREPDLVAPGSITFLAHALVVPSLDPADLDRHLKNVEAIAMNVVTVFEEAEGAIVIDVHTPELARKANLPDNPGFDLLSIRKTGERRSIEVKGRATIGDVEVSSNEWAKACNMRQNYWLYTVYDCATPNPRLMRVQDPFGSLLAKAKGSMVIGPKQIMAAAESRL